MRKSNPGFTLIELLLSLAIFSIMAVAVYSAFASGIGVWRKAKEVGSIHQTARLMLDEIAEDLRNTVMISGSPFMGKSDRVSFLIVRRDAATSGGLIASEVRRITYEVKRDETSPYDAIYRLDESYVEGLQEGHEKPEYFGGPITAFELQYVARDEESGVAMEWKAVWDEEDLFPIGVKITLAMPGRQKEGAVFTKTVFMPQGLREKEDKDEG